MEIDLSEFSFQPPMKKSQSEPGKHQAILVALVLFLTTLLGYIARTNISVALPFIASDYGWTQHEVGELGGLVLGIFLLGYGISNVFISPLVDYFGPRRALMMCVAVWSFFTLMTGALGAFYSMIILSRLMLGFSQGILFPSASKLTQAWFPPTYRSRINALHLSSGFASNILAAVILIPLILATSWEIMFYAVAIAGFLLLIPIWRIIRDSPAGEVMREKKSIREIFVQTKESIRESLKVPGIFRLTFAFWTVNTVWWGLSLWLPTYLNEARGLPIGELVWAASLPYVGGLAGMYLGSWLSDRLQKRAVLTSFFCIMSASMVLLLSVTYGEVQIVAVLALLWLFLGIAPVNSFTLMQGMAPPRLIGSATGIMNGIANGSGIAGPMIIGMAVSFTSNYDTGLVIMAMMMFVGSLFYLQFRKMEK